jgi:hypothetical protein
VLHHPHQNQPAIGINLQICLLKLFLTIEFWRASNVSGSKCRQRNSGGSCGGWSCDRLANDWPKALSLRRSATPAVRRSGYFMIVFD